jgi:hypothetical protein
MQGWASFLVGRALRYRQAEAAGAGAHRDGAALPAKHDVGAQNRGMSYQIRRGCAQRHAQVLGDFLREDG